MSRSRSITQAKKPAELKIARDRNNKYAVSDEEDVELSDIDNHEPKPSNLDILRDLFEDWKTNFPDVDLTGCIEQGRHYSARREKQRDSIQEVRSQLKDKHRRLFEKANHIVGCEIGMFMSSLSADIRNRFNLRFENAIETTRNAYIQKELAHEANIPDLREMFKDVTTIAYEVKKAKCIIADQKEVVTNLKAAIAKTICRHCGERFGKSWNLTFDWYVGNIVCGHCSEKNPHNMTESVFDMLNESN